MEFSDEGVGWDFIVQWMVFVALKPQSINVLAKQWKDFRPIAMHFSRLLERTTEKSSLHGCSWCSSTYQQIDCCYFSLLPFQSLDPPPLFNAFEDFLQIVSLTRHEWLLPSLSCSLIINILHSLMVWWPFWKGFVGEIVELLKKKKQELQI